jgi:protein tyrosine phosphatase (PTP) superfamily phosphohydrolase (DUF442 family)
MALINRIIPVALIAVALALANSSAPVAQEAGRQQSPQSASPTSPPPVSGNLLPLRSLAEQFPNLHNLLQISERIFSGGEPQDEQAFAALAELGVRTVVSVDGARPDVEAARRHGLRYVHIPVGYDGVSEAAGKSLARLMKDASAPLYIHCHHGKHRGPAAAAVACIADGAADGETALEVLRRAGTSARYAGLWRDVAAYRPPASGEPLPELVEVAEIGSLTAAMAQIDRATDHLRLCQSNHWRSPPDNPDVVPVQQALLLKEAYRETVRQLEADNGYDARFLSWMKQAESVADDLQHALEQKDTAAVTLHFITAAEHCGRCHQHYRD